jgi:hypothetical protein
MLVPFPFLQNFCVYASKKVQKGAKRCKKGVLYAECFRAAAAAAAAAAVVAAAKKKHQRIRPVPAYLNASLCRLVQRFS